MAMSCDNLIYGVWSNPPHDASLFLTGDGMHIVNRGDDDCFVRQILPDSEQAPWVSVEFQGTDLVGRAGVLYLVDEFNAVIADLPFDSTSLIALPSRKEYAFLIKVFPHSEIVISHISFEYRFDDSPAQAFLQQSIKASVAAIVPTYPTKENKYLCAFVHSRVKAFIEAGIACDVICAFDYQNYSLYEFEGVRVLRISLDLLAEVINLAQYRVLISHFFDERYAGAFDTCNLQNTNLILKISGPETQYWDYPLFTSPYFSELPALTDEQTQEFSKLDSIIKRYNAMSNVTWFFVSQAVKDHSEELLGITFERALITPEVIDEDLFAFQEKDIALRRKVFTCRKFENISTYAVDISVQCILELSKRPCFAELEFDIYGYGGFYDELVEPISHFENVHLKPYFISHEDIARIHAESGIGLFATRYDTQGVSMGEAAMSGLAVVSSKIPTAEYFLPDDIGLLADVENPVAYADIIEHLYNDPAYFTQCSRACHDKMYKLCRREVTVQKEIDYIKRLLSADA